MPKMSKTQKNTKEIGYFDVLTSIVNKKKIPNEYIEKLYNPFGTMRWLYEHPQALYEANILNSSRGIGKIPKIAEYKALKGIISINKKTFIKSSKTNSDLDIFIRLLLKHYNINTDLAKEYLFFMDSKDLLHLVTLYAREHESNLGNADIKEVNEYRGILKKYRKDIENKISCKGLF